jgi:hypothetical protein
MSDQNGGGSANGYVKAFLLGNLGADPEMRYLRTKSRFTNPARAWKRGRLICLEIKLSGDL